MTEDQIQNFLLQKGKFLPPRRINELSLRLKHLEDSKSFRVSSVSTSNPTLFTILYWLLPFVWVIDRFITGQCFTGFIKLLFPVVFIVFVLWFSENPSGMLIGKAYLEQWISTVMMFLYPLWIFIDGFTIYNRIKRHNYNKIIKSIK